MRPLLPLLLLLCGLWGGCDRRPPVMPSQAVALLGAPLTATDAAARVQRGEALYYANSCSNCHVLKGPTRGAPRLARLYSSPAPLVGGESRVRDRAYLARSILSPRADVVAGYSQQMSVYRHLSAADVAALIAFLETHSPPPAVPHEPHATDAASTPDTVKADQDAAHIIERRSRLLP